MHTDLFNELTQSLKEATAKQNQVAVLYWIFLMLKLSVKRLAFLRRSLLCVCMLALAHCKIGSKIDVRQQAQQQHLYVY